VRSSSCGNFRPEKRSPRRNRSLLCTALGLAGLLMVGCGSAIPHQRPASRPEPVATPQTPTASSLVRAPLQNIYSRALRNPAVTVTPSGTYVAWQLSPPASPSAHYELARIDVSSGRILASRQISAVVGQVDLASGALWVVTANSHGRGMLLKLNPHSLEAASRWHPVSLTVPNLRGNALALAGGWLWIADGDHLLRLSLPAGSVTKSVPMRGVDSSDVSADSSGTTLIDGESDAGGQGALQRRDPATGALLASHPLSGVAAPLVTGPIDGLVWVAEPTGMQGYVEAFRSSDLAVSGSGCHEGAVGRTCIPGDNGIIARVADGLVWVTQQNGGNARNYCAAAGTGEVLAPIRLRRPAQDEVLAIGAGRIFYASPSAGVGSYVHQEAVPMACRS